MTETERVLGIGVDLVDLERFRRILMRTPRVVDRLFTDAEKAYAERKRDSAERYAARFAAKEAVLKAMHIGIFNFPLTEIEIVRDDDSGAPFVRLHGKALVMATERGVGSWRLTMTHIDTAAQAVAMAIAAPEAPSLRLALSVADPQRTVTFYEDVMGFVCERHDDAGSSDLRLGSVELEITRRSAGRPGAQSVEVVIDVADVDAWHRRVSEHLEDVPPLEERPWGRRDFSITDPDGVPVRITSRG